MSNNKIKVLIGIFLLLIIGTILYYHTTQTGSPAIYVSDEQYDIIKTKIEEIFITRNNAILEKNSENIKKLYNRNLRNGLWACEHALKKMKYLHSWSEKQGIIFENIKSKIIIRYIKKKSNGFNINLLVSTEYIYSYVDTPQNENSFRIGTYHSLDLIPHSNLDTNVHSENSLDSHNSMINKKFLITREWYTDPFADSLHLDKVKNENIQTTILKGIKKDLAQINEKRKSALNYAKKYCGAASIPEYNYEYNKKYRNYNNLGGDCANFASQILHEGGGFRKNDTWNYYRGSGSRAWLNAHAFNNYMIYSGRGTLIARGSYEKVLKQSYQLLPGDYIAYEKNGKVVHISVVSGSDSKGYTLVISHNTDRYHVPWDLGWSNDEIRFRLVRVHY